MANILLNAHLLSAQAGYRSAGIHGYIYHTLRYLPLVQPDWMFHVLVSEGQPPTASNLIVHRSQFSTTYPVKRIFWEQILQPRVIEQIKPDLYHGMAFVTPLSLHVPSVVTIYDLSFIHYPQALSTARRLYLRWFTRRSCQEAKCVIAISESTANDLVRWMGIPRRKIVVAVPGISEDFHPLSSAEVKTFRQKKGLPDRFILHLGTLEPRKNLPLLLRAYAALPENLRQEVHLVLAGGKGWDYQAVFETIERHSLGQTVHWVGYVAGEELPLWYNAAEALVYPSLYEGWGLPVSEAMACGCPTLVSNSSSLPEAAGNTGKRLPAHDEAAWTDALYEVMTNDTWRQESRRAGLAHAQRFTWQATAEATIQAYRQALKGE
jgi:glycosyltransferase involved in cell wall biosynthesis